MKKLTIFLIFLFSSLSVVSQTCDSTAIVVLQQQVDTLQAELKKQQTDFSNRISKVNGQIKSLQHNIDSTQSMIDAVSENVNNLKDSMDKKISETAEHAKTKITAIYNDVDRRSLFGIIGGVILLLLSVGLFLYLLSKQKTDSKKLIIQLKEQKSAIETKLVREYSRQAEVLLNLMKAIREIPVSATDDGTPDHSLALKLADEITLMERNISHMNQETKGLKPLIRAIERLKANLNSNGYELVELISKPYTDGLKVTIVSSVPDENANKGEDIITKIIKPQVNFHDKMIQMAQVEIAVGIN
jgi:DNA-binding FrmR family transcriptional regulator